MFDDDDDLFDLDGDGDCDIEEYLIMEDILTEEENLFSETDDYDDDDDDDWKEEVEDGSDYLLDPYDYDSKKEYLEDLKEAKHRRRVSAKRFETDDEYEDTAKEACRPSSNGSITLRFNIKFGGNNTADEAVAADTYVASTLASGTVIKDSVKENTSGSPYYAGIAERKSTAESMREFFRDSDTSKEEVLRCEFILNNEAKAAQYLTYDGKFLYAQAVKDHFRLPFEIPNETNCIKTDFTSLLVDLVENDVNQALLIWEWCLDTFLPHMQYANYDGYITDIGMGLFIDEFPKCIVDYMVKRPEFIEKLIGQSTRSPREIEIFVKIALEAGHTETAKRVMECAFNNPHTTADDIAQNIQACINICSGWDGEGLETMKAFRQHIFPIVFTQTDVRITNKIAGWQKEMTEYIDEWEESAKADMYSSQNDRVGTHSDEDDSPANYDFEKECLKAAQAMKYDWRADCRVQYGVNPNDFETRAEYDAAINAGRQKQLQAQKEELEAMYSDKSLYKFCKVSINFPERPHYYYFTGKLELKAGDRVKVPFGWDNKIVDAVVMSIGECYGCSLPCPASRVKNVIKKV